MSAAPLIAFIGGGNMARAMVGGLLRAGHPAARIRVADPDAGQRSRIAALAADLGVGDDNAAAADGADGLVLAVKPQSLADVARALGPRPAGQLVLSIAAGITLASLGDWLGQATARVRVMPNQPALVGAGVSVLVASPGVDAAGRALAERIAASAGSIAWLDDERLMDAVTAVSGSGPAYFYLLMEALTDAAAELGLPRELADRLVRATAAGAGTAAEQLAVTPGELRASVTSPGGTTAAALAVLEGADIRAIVRRAVAAAHDRSVELGRPSADTANRRDQD